MRVLRILGIILGAIVVILVVAFVVIYFRAQAATNAHYDNPTLDVGAVQRTPERLARGAYMAGVMPGCVGCHASNPAANPPLLDGNLVEDLKPLGNFYAPNLTPGGPLKDWSDGDIIRAIREGVDKNGRGLLIMPSGEYKNLSDEDVQSIVAYLRSQPAVQKDTPPPTLSFLGIMLSGTGQVRDSRQPPVRNVAAPPRGPSAAYGNYLVETTGCTACHGPTLDGTNQPPGPPKGPSLRVVKGWTDAQFLQTMRTGVDPSGHALDPRQMPWQAFGHGTDDDLKAIYEYLKSLG